MVFAINPKKQIFKIHLRATTLMEIMIVIILFGVVAGLGIPIYTKSLLKASEREAVSNLIVVSGANQMLRARTGSYWDTAGSTITDLNLINQELNINMISTNMTYSYQANSSVDPNVFTAYATYNTGESNEFRLRVNQAIVSSTNPCCDSGNNCPSRPAC